MSSIDINRKYEKVIAQLIKAGVDEKVLEYLRGEKGKSNFYVILGKVQEILGDNILYNNSTNIELLKEGSNTFRITEDGGIWFMLESDKSALKGEDTTIRIGGNKHTFPHGPFVKDPNKENATYYNYIERDGEDVIFRSINVTQSKRGERISYLGKISKKIIIKGTVLREEHEAMWVSENSSDIPDMNLDTTKQIYSENSWNWLPIETSHLAINYSQDPKWQFVKSGRTLGEAVAEQIEEETVNRLIDWHKAGKVIYDLVQGLFKSR